MNRAADTDNVHDTEDAAVAAAAHSLADETADSVPPAAAGVMVYFAHPVAADWVFDFVRSAAAWAIDSAHSAGD